MPGIESENLMDYVTNLENKSDCVISNKNLIKSYIFKG